LRAARPVDTAPGRLDVPGCGQVFAAVDPVLTAPPALAGRGRGPAFETGARRGSGLAPGADARASGWHPVGQRFASGCASRVVEPRGGGA
jgi:hypothetical protein